MDNETRTQADSVIDLRDQPTRLQRFGDASNIQVNVLVIFGGVGVSVVAVLGLVRILFG